MRYIGSLSGDESAPQETHAKTFEFSADKREAANTIDKASGAHPGQYLSFHADLAPSALNHAQ